MTVVCLADGQNLGSLKRVRAPQPANLSQYVRDADALVLLGKAFFWDMQTGSDGRTACATCHFHAGADHRTQSQLSNANGALNPNKLLTASDFPFHALSDPTRNGSAALHDTSAVAGSAGLFRRVFRDVAPGISFDDGFDAADATFSVNGVNTRQVTIRNTPSVINSVFNARNFWDGRASNIFTGATPFGDSDPGLNALSLATGKLVAERVRLDNSSLASQAVGPPLNSTEMSYDGRTWPQLGKKMLSLQPLALQKIAGDDSVLGAWANPSGAGFAAPVTYLDLIRAAFQPAYWQTDELVDANGQSLGRNGEAANTREFTAAEFNFPVFWGLALQAYEATLVADDSNVDRFFDGMTAALTADEQRGLRVFQSGASDCTNCHNGPELTLAGITSVNQRGPIGGPGGGGGRGGNVDTGFFRTGVRPIAEDIGLGGVDGFGNPLSLAVARNAAARNGVQGLFKTPGLRNVEFTGPYFHNGGQATLEQVVEFYSRGGDFPAGGNLGPGIQNQNLSAADRASLVAFLKALTDDRVRYERAPFDHPEICVPAGYDQLDAVSLKLDSTDARFTMSAASLYAGIPAVGKSGNAVPLQTFDELLRGVGADGTRAHTLRDVCSIQ